jgi:hypothetical protein
LPISLPNCPWLFSDASHVAVQDLHHRQPLDEDGDLAMVTVLACSGSGCARRRGGSATDTLTAGSS